MRRELPDGLELDDDRARVDVDAVYRFLSEEAYWVRGRSQETIERLVRESTRVVAAYDGDTLIAFCRVMSDGSNMAWLGDVFVVPSHRGRGVGVELVREAVEHPEHRDLQWFLGTRDAHELYARFGFDPAERADDGSPAPRTLDHVHASVAAVPFPLPGHHAYHRACPTRDRERMPGAAGNLFGRDDELAEVARFIGSVPEGPCGLLFEGEAGIGKTALWLEAVGTARGLGIVVLSTRPVESETTFSYSALGDLFEDVFEAVAGDIPAPQRRALGIALVRAEADGPPPDQHAVSMAALGVLRVARGVGSVHPRHRRRPMDRSVVGSRTGVRRSSSEG